MSEVERPRTEARILLDRMKARRKELSAPKTVAERIGDALDYIPVPAFLDRARHHRNVWVRIPCRVMVTAIKLAIAALFIAALLNTAAPG
jgi:hypothetical protein